MFTEKISKKIVIWLIQNNSITVEEKELYEYAACCFITTLLPLSIILLTGIIGEVLVESILLILPFMCLRKYAGGFHAKRPYQCLILSCILVWTMLYFTCNTDNGLILIVICSVFVITIIVASPINFSARGLTIKECKKYKYKVIIILGVIFLISIVAEFNKFKKISNSLMYGIMLTGILQLPCIIKEIKKK